MLKDKWARFAVDVVIANWKGSAPATALYERLRGQEGLEKLFDDLEIEVNGAYSGLPYSSIARMVEDLAHSAQVYEELQ
jgi:hypothetical protein